MITLVLWRLRMKISGITSPQLQQKIIDSIKVVDYCMFGFSIFCKINNTFLIRQNKNRCQYLFSHKHTIVRSFFSAYLLDEYRSFLSSLSLMHRIFVVVVVAKPSSTTSFALFVFSLLFRFRDTASISSSVIICSPSPPTSHCMMDNVWPSVAQWSIDNGTVSCLSLSSSMIIVICRA